MQNNKYWTLYISECQKICVLFDCAFKFIFTYFCSEIKLYIADELLYPKVRQPDVKLGYHGSIPAQKTESGVIVLKHQFGVFLEDNAWDFFQWPQQPCVKSFSWRKTCWLTHTHGCWTYSPLCWRFNIIT